MTGPLFPGTCRYCKCTEERPCGFYRGGEAVSCSWLHGTVPIQTVCTGPDCLWKWTAHLRDQARRANQQRSRTARRQAWR